MKNRQTWLIIGLTALVIYLILSQPSRPDSAVTITARDSVLKIIEHNRVLAMSAKTLEFNLAKAIIKSSSDSARFIREITVKNQQLARKRVVVQHIIDTIPELKDFVETADNVIELQRQRIDTLEQNIKFREGLYNDLVYLKAKQISNLEIVSSQKDIIIKDQEKTLKKIRRGNKLLKIALPIAVVGVLVSTQ